MRRDVRITSDIQKLLLNMQLCRLVIPDAWRRKDNYATGRIIALSGEDFEISLAKPATLEFSDWGSNYRGDGGPDFKQILNRKFIREERDRLRANSYILGDVPDTGRTINVPMVFCYSRKAEAALGSHRPF